MTEITTKGGDRLMANTALQKVSVSIKLDNGTDSQGNTKLVGISLGSLDKTAFDADKVLAIVSALGPVLDKSVDHVEKTEVSTIAAA